MKETEKRRVEGQKIGFRAKKKQTPSILKVANDFSCPEWLLINWLLILKKSVFYLNDFRDVF